MIEVADLAKYFQVHQKEPGFWGSLKSLFSRRYHDVKAVDGISFHIEPGEVVGFLGPNGAGKTTTLKILSGLLYPTRGQVTVLGHVPFRRSGEFLRAITLVMGQKNQLVWDLAAYDSFLVNRALYEIPPAEFKRTLQELADLLDLEPLLRKQVRKLSLGERMKCELAAALLHRPQVLFLDEPTIGLDVTMQARIRQFIAEYNRRSGATVILTSHYMADVVALCRRVLVINAGKLLYDGDLKALGHEVAPYKLIRLTLREPASNGVLHRYGEVKLADGYRAELLVPREQTSLVASRMLAELPLADFTVEDPAIDEVIGRVFTRGLNAPEVRQSA